VKVLPPDKKTFLPLPVSPNNNTGASVGTAIGATVIAWVIERELQMIESKLL